MRLLSCLLPIAVVLAGCTPQPMTDARPDAAGAAPAASGTCAVSRQAAAAEVTAEINALRRSHGLNPLTTNAHLGRIAQGHACDNAIHRSHSHTGSAGSTLASRLKAGGYPYRSAKENTGLGRFDSAGMVAFWRNSPPHYQNMLDPSMTELGLGVAATGDGRNAWVLKLARRR